MPHIFILTHIFSFSSRKNMYFSVDYIFSTIYININILLIYIYYMQLLVWDRQGLGDSQIKDESLIKYWMNKGVYRTALAAQGLLKIVFVFQVFCDSYVLLKKVSTNLTFHWPKYLFIMDNHIDLVCQCLVWKCFWRPISSWNISKT